MDKAATSIDWLESLGVSLSSRPPISRAATSPGTS
jgi:hypothetical protein